MGHSFFKFENFIEINVIHKFDLCLNFCSFIFDYEMCQFEQEWLVSMSVTSHSAFIGRFIDTDLPNFFHSHTGSNNYH